MCYEMRAARVRRYPCVWGVGASVDIDAALRKSFVLFILATAAAPARDRTATFGSAIALEYSLQHDTLEPATEVTLMACVTNENTHSSRDVAPGDSFAFTFHDGVLVSCDSVQAFPSDGSLAGAFTCETDGNILRLRFHGPRPMRWNVGEAACATVTYMTGLGPSTVESSFDVGNEGAYLTPSPAAILLSVASGLDRPGPMGPMGLPGPAGPSGPPGPAGAVAFAVSTGSAQARHLEPPVPIPGMDASVNVGSGSRLEVHVDAIAIPCDSPMLHLGQTSCSRASSSRSTAPTWHGGTPPARRSMAMVRRSC